MEVLEIYKKIKEKINLIDFNSLWNGFSEFRFALYDDVYVYFDGFQILKDDRFIGNTAINYGGEYVAIWRLDSAKSMDINILVSKIIHEMFHAFQYKLFDFRFPNEVKGIIKYEYDASNLSIKFEQNRLLVKLYNHFNIDDLFEYISCKAYQKSKFAYQFTYESKVEVIEGMAQFIELLVLKKLDASLFYKYIGNLKEKLLNKNKLFPIRNICYDSGALILLICAENDIDIYHDIGLETRTLSEILIDKFPNIRKTYIPIDLEIENILNEYRDKTKEIIDSKLNKATMEKVDYQLLGLDPFNSRRYYDFIYCPYFIGLNIDNKFVPLVGDYVVYVEGDRVKELYKINE